MDFQKLSSLLVARFLKIQIYKNLRAVVGHVDDLVGIEGYR